MRLAPLAPADALDLLAAVEESRDDMSHISWAPLVTDLESAERTARALGATGTWAVRDCDGVLVGLVGLEAVSSLACWTRTGAQGMGYASDAARMLIALQRPAHVLADPSRDNARSLSLVRRLGFRAYPDRIVHYLHRGV